MRHCGDLAAEWSLSATLAPMRRLAVGLATMALVATGCAGTTGVADTGSAPTVLATTVPTGSGSATTTSVTDAPPTTDPSPGREIPAAGEWVTSIPVFESDGYSNAVEPTLPRVDILTSAAGAYWAAGSIGGHPTIWRSDDLIDFKVVYFDDWEPSPRWIRFSSLIEFEGKVLAGGSGRGDGNVERSYLLVSSDSGETWTDIDDPVLSTPFQRLDGLVASGGALLLDVVNDECCSTPGWQPVRTVDLQSFDPMILPESTAETWGSFIGDGIGTVWVVARIGEGDSAQAIWSSTDGGSSWVRSGAEVNFARGMAAVDGSLMLIPSTEGYDMVSGPGSTEPLHLIRIADGSWSTLDDDVGQWGDGPASLFGINDPDTGRFYGIARRAIRANAHYCLDDVDTCAQPEMALVTSADGVDWFDVVGPELRPRHSKPFMTVDGRIAIWSWPFDGNTNDLPTVSRWVGDPIPPLVDPAGYPPPVAPVPLFDPAEGLPVGTERRIVWGLGPCGGLFIDGISWGSAGPPDTTGWPIRKVEISDGPSAVAYGRVTRLAEDSIRFTVEGTDAAVDLAPVTSDGPYCG